MRKLLQQWLLLSLALMIFAAAVAAQTTPVFLRWSQPDFVNVDVWQVVVNGVLDGRVQKATASAEGGGIFHFTFNVPGNLTQADDIRLVAINTSGGGMSDPSNIYVWPTATPTASLTVTPIPTPEPTVTRTSTPTASQTATATATKSPTPSQTPLPTQTVTQTVKPSPQAPQVLSIQIIVVVTSTPPPITVTVITPTAGP